MKKGLSILAAAAFVFSLSSCKKDYVCECTVNGVVDNSLSIPKAKKSDAEAACQAYQIAGEVCTLK